MHHPSHITIQEKTKELSERVERALKEQFGEGILQATIDYDFPVFEVEKSILHDVLSFLKTKEDLGFTYLTTLCGIHFPEQAEREFAMMYQLHNMQQNWRIRLKTFMSVKDMELPTATDLWKGANWMEREAFDFYGFRFKGHPDLRRILNMDEMNYHPMRKQYALEDGSRDDKEDKYFGR